ncbi:MAG: sigma-54-dependent Fis family transcriptional regulator, partial [bacterium]|nr:sigma-54-dependent Fis family transcriptional regulator [bacterium]
KGAFTGATSNQQGLVQAADGGTLFLDEIGEMPLSAQTRLLRLIQEHEFTPIGSTETINIDLRIVSATHRNLQAMIKESNFREDLYYRICEYQLELPPLRNRTEDINSLILATISKFNPDKNDETSQTITVEKKAIQLLNNYSWPGNIRELINVTNRCVLDSIIDETRIITSEIVNTHIDNPVSSRNSIENSIMENISNNDSNITDVIQQIKTNTIKKVVSESRTKAEAAKKLGISAQSLNQYIKTS